MLDADSRVEHLFIVCGHVVTRIAAAVNSGTCAGLVRKAVGADAIVDKRNALYGCWRDVDAQLLRRAIGRHAIDVQSGVNGVC